MAEDFERGLILVVDDNETARYAKARTLRNAGYETLEAGSGAEAMRLVAERKPRLLLAKICDKQGRAREAAAVFEELVHRSPHSRESREAGKRLAAIAVEFARAGQLEPSARAYGAALKTRAGMDEAVFLNAALVYYRLGRRGEAQDVLRQAARSFPASADIHYRLGRLLSEAGRTRPLGGSRPYRRTASSTKRRGPSKRSTKSYRLSEGRPGPSSPIGRGGIHSMQAVGWQGPSCKDWACRRPMRQPPTSLPIHVGTSIPAPVRAAS